MKLASKLKDNKLTENERNNLRKQTSTFVSGNQALDLLIKLATQKFDLFDKLFTSSFNVPAELIQYMPDYINRNPIDYIT